MCSSIYLQLGRELVLYSGNRVHVVWIIVQNYVLFVLVWSRWIYSYSTCNIADEIPHCCNCRGCKEAYAKRSGLARPLNVHDKISTRHHAIVQRMVEV